MKLNSSIKNVFSLGVLQIFNYVLPLFSVPYLLITLGPEANGYLITSQTIISYFALLIDYGFVLTASKKVALTKKREEIERVFSTVFISKVILFLLGTIIFIIVSIFISNKIFLICILIGFFQVLGFLFNPVWLFQGTENADVLAKINIIVRTIFYFSLFIFIQSSNELYFAVFLLSFPHFIVGLISYFKAKSYFDIKLVRVTQTDVLRELRDGFYGFWVTLMNFTYTASGILLLGIFSSQEIVGIYGTVEKLIKAGVQVFNPIIHGLYPKVLNLLQNDKIREFKRILYTSFSISTILGMVVFLLSPLISKVFLGDVSSQYSINVLRILSIWFSLNTINVVTGIWIFFSKNQMKVYTKIYTIATFCCTLFHFMLIPVFGPKVVPVNLVIGEIIVSIFLYYLLKRGRI